MRLGGRTATHLTRRHVLRMPCGVVSVVVGRVRSVVWPVACDLACALACARVRTGGARRVHRAAPGETRYVRSCLSLVSA